jgi:hypothetical protein
MGSILFLCLSAFVFVVKESRQRSCKSYRYGYLLVLHSSYIRNENCVRALYPVPFSSGPSSSGTRPVGQVRHCASEDANKGKTTVAQREEDSRLESLFFEGVFEGASNCTTSVSAFRDENSSLSVHRLIARALNVNSEMG